MNKSFATLGHSGLVRFVAVLLHLKLISRGDVLRQTSLVTTCRLKEPRAKIGSAYSDLITTKILIHT